MQGLARQLQNTSCGSENERTTQMWKKKEGIAMTLVRYFPGFARPVFGRPTDELARWPSDWPFDAPLNAEWYPRADVVETDNAWEISVELPGIEKDAVKVSVENGVLSISGETKAEHKDEGRGVYRLERRYGSFSRTFELPDGVDAEKIEAVFRNGLLKLTVPKTAEVLPKTIEIKHE
ncbi:MAG: Spore protein SP21 [Candidatus Latescibacteria bacterium ADurb.Bin168]|nr:MAG: Spore protein SP21 [Candidatus Latescibacteria bacterium ADurb.Bin168]